jgi:hypothetical protein
LEGPQGVRCCLAAANASEVRTALGHSVPLLLQSYSPFPAHTRACKQTYAHAQAERDGLRSELSAASQRDRERERMRSELSATEAQRRLEAEAEVAAARVRALSSTRARPASGTVIVTSAVHLLFILPQPRSKLSASHA